MKEAISVKDEQKGTADSETSAMSAPVRGRRGKKTEATAAPVVQMSTRSRNTKSSVSSAVELSVKNSSTLASNMVCEPIRGWNTKKASDDLAEIVSVVIADPEIVPEPKSEQTTPVESSRLRADHSEAATKPTRGKKTKQIVAEPFQEEKEEAVSEQHPPDNDKPEKPCPTLGKNTRGKRTKTDDVQSAAVEKRELRSAPLLRAKREQINKQESVEKETSQSQEPVKNLRRTRKVEQDPVQNYEEDLSKEAEASVDTKPAKVEPNMATRARRAQKAAQVKQLPESADVQKSAAISVADKPTRSRRGKQVVEDMSEENPELKAEDEKNKKQEASVVKRMAKTVKNDVPETIPAKRARRGASLPPVETKAESADLGSKSESYSKELPRRGRRAVKPSAEVAILSGEELRTAVGEDAKMPTKSVKWESDEVFEIQKLTPVKLVRGRKAKVGDRVEIKNQKDSSKIEEKYLSDKVEVQATKRARRGVVFEESSSKVAHVQPQPKTRRVRVAKK